VARRLPAHRDGRRRGVGARAGLRGGAGRCGCRVLLPDCDAGRFGGGRLLPVLRGALRRCALRRLVCIFVLQLPNPVRALLSLFFPARRYNNKRPTQTQTRVCVCLQDNVRASWPVVWELAATRKGRTILTQAFRLCDALASEDDVWSLAYWIQSAWLFALRVWVLDGVWLAGLTDIHVK
jgi:hypothetical protein